MKKYLLTFTLVLTPLLAVAQPSPKQVDACQAYSLFLDDYLSTAPAKYDAEKIKTIRKSLKSYDQYLQNTFTTPYLLEVTRGDKTKAKALQSDIDQAKKNTVTVYRKQFKNNMIYMDHVLGLTNCAEHAKPKGATLKQLETSIELLFGFAQQ